MSRNSYPYVREMMREAVEALGSPTTNTAVQDWIAERYPGTNQATVQAHCIMCCVNQPSRAHYPENQRPRVADDPRYDFLFRPERGKLEWYDPEKHGVWTIEQDDEGKFAIACDDGDLIYPRARQRSAEVSVMPPKRPSRAAIPILASQIDAARRLHDRLEQWSATERAFERLRESFSGFDREACMIKSAAINDLYSTRVYAIWRMAEHLIKVMAAPPEDPCELVAAIASLPGPEGHEVERRHWSFASKICHFFVDSDTHPIYDSFCRDMIAYHLGRGSCVSDRQNPYRAFRKNLEWLQQLSGLSVSLRDMDRYLWLAGQYRAWLKRGDDAQTNSELRSLFENESPEVQRDIEALAPDLEPSL